MRYLPRGVIGQIGLVKNDSGVDPQVCIWYASYMTTTKMSTEGITADEHGNISAVGREAVNMYAFLMIRRALKFRVETGMSMLRGQEMKGARNHGWTTAKTAKKCLADLNAIAVEMGIEPI